MLKRKEIDLEYYIRALGYEDIREELKEEYERYRKGARIKNKVARRLIKDFIKRASLRQLKIWRSKNGFKVLSSQGDKFYYVKLDGVQFSCTCEGYKHYGYCKHIQAILYRWLDIYESGGNNSIG